MGKRRKNRQGRVQKPVQKSARNRWIPFILGSAVIAATITAIVERAYLMPSRIRMEYLKELRVQSAPQLRALHHLATVGNYMLVEDVILKPPPAHMLEAAKRDTTYIIINSLGFQAPLEEDTLTLTFPALVRDFGVRDRWNALQAQVDGQLGTLDFEAFQEYQKLQLFLLRYPLPPSDTLAESAMPWSETAVQAEWHDINDRICCLSERLLKLAQLAEDRSTLGVVRFAIADHRTRSLLACEPAPRA